jgi:hypothetical protein
MKNVISHSTFISMIPAKGRSYLLLYKHDSENSLCAYSNIDEIMRDELPVFSADVSLVRDIHVVYGIDTVPSLLVFEDGIFRNVVKGCHESSYYEALFNNDLFTSGNKSDSISPCSKISFELINANCF